MHQRYKYGQAFHPPPCQLRHLIRVPYTHTTQSHVVLRPGLTGILAFPQSAGALWQSDANRLQSLKFSLRQLATLDPFFGRFGSDESVLSSSRAHIRLSIEARKAKKSEREVLLNYAPELRACGRSRIDAVSQGCVSDVSCS